MIRCPRPTLKVFGLLTHGDVQLNSQAEMLLNFLQVKIIDSVCQGCQRPGENRKGEKA